MSRSGYTEIDAWDLIKWRGAVASALRGHRGQRFLREALSALDSLPQPRLIADSLQGKAAGEYCLMGAVAAARGADVSDVDAYERDEVACALDIAPALAAEVAYENDEHASTPEERFTWMRNWVLANIVVTPDELIPFEGEAAQ